MWESITAIWLNIIVFLKLHWKTILTFGIYDLVELVKEKKRIKKWKKELQKKT